MTGVARLRDLLFRLVCGSAMEPCCSSAVRFAAKSVPATSRATGLLRGSVRSIASQAPQSCAELRSTRHGASGTAQPRGALRKPCAPGATAGAVRWRSSGPTRYLARKLVERSDLSGVVAGASDEVDAAFLTDATRELLDVPTVIIPDDDSKLGVGGPPGQGTPGFPQRELDLSAFEGARDTDPFSLVAADMQGLTGGIQELLGVDHPVLSTVAKYFFEMDGGKKMRPAIVMLVSRAANVHALTEDRDAVADEAAQELRQKLAGVPRSPVNESDEARAALESGVAKSWLEPSQRRLAEITEMIHTASLLHDDVIDLADTRRGVGSVNRVFGNKLAVLGGDFLLARASVCLARLRDVEVIELLSTVIEHLVKGEVMQMKTAFRDGNALESAFAMYMRKTYYKTASLMANSCKAAALLAGHSPAVCEAAFLYGKHVGLAFQLVDDVLDFEGSLESLGKPALNDLRQGLATAPVLFAASGHPNMATLIGRKFEAPGDIDEACRAVTASSGVEKTRLLALEHAQLALDAVAAWAPSPERDALAAVVTRVVERKF